MSIDIAALTVAVLVFLLAGFVKGVIGLGLPTVSIGLLSLMISPTYAAALLIVPSVITNIQQMRPLSMLIGLVKRLWPLLAGVVAGTLAGAGWLTAGSARLMAAGLGVMLFLYAMIGLSKLRFHIPLAWEKWSGLAAGLVTGLITAATGVFVIPAVPYLQAIGLEKDDLVQALGLSFFVSTLALGASLSLGGLAFGSVALASLAMIVPALAEQFAGQAVRHRIDIAGFRLWFHLGLAALGAWLVAKWLIG